MKLINLNFNKNMGQLLYFELPFHKLSITKNEIDVEHNSTIENAINSKPIFYKHERFIRILNRYSKLF